jgi:hypothetical protein
MLRAFGITAGLTVLCASPLAALEDDFGGFSDLRLNLQAYGVGYDVTFLGATESDNFDMTYRLGATWIASLGLVPGYRGGLLVGLGFNYGIMNGSLVNDADVSLQSWVGQMYVGWGWEIADRWQLEVLPMAAFGRAYMNIDNGGGGISNQSGDDKLVEFGVMGNLIYTYPNGLQLGGTFGYQFSNTLIKDEQAGLEFDWNTSNPTIGFIIGARL